MEQKNEEVLIKRYLLGDVIQQEQDEIQDRLFMDSDFFNLLLMIEKELTDNYLFNNLQPHERIQFEQYFLRSPERRRRLRIAEELMLHASSESRVKPAALKRSGSWRAFFLNPRFAYSALMILVAAVIIWLLRDRQIMKDKIAELRTRQDTQQKQDENPRSIEEKLAERQTNSESITQLPVKGEKLSNSRAEGKVNNKRAVSTQSSNSGGVRQLPFESRNVIEPPESISLEPQDLWPGQTRDAGRTNQVRVQRGVKQVLLKLHLEDNKDPGYQVDIRDARDRKLRVFDDVKPEKADDEMVLFIKVPARLLKRGDYLITVQGIRSSGGFGDSSTYQFRVKPK